MNKIIIETQNDLAASALVQFLRQFNNVFTIEENINKPIINQKHLPVIEPDKDANPEILFGIWKGKKVTLRQIREKAWGGRL